MPFQYHFKLRMICAQSVSLIIKTNSTISVFLDQRFQENVFVFKENMYNILIRFFSTGYRSHTLERVGKGMLPVSTTLISKLLRVQFLRLKAKRQHPISRNLLTLPFARFRFPLKSFFKFIVYWPVALEIKTVSLKPSGRSRSQKVTNQSIVKTCYRIKSQQAAS